MLWCIEAEELDAIVAQNPAALECRERSSVLSE
jgi:hypothetical protein